jgi:hypothetical protein
VFLPFFSEVLAQGDGKFDVETFGSGSMKSFSFGLGKVQPAWWAFDLVSNWMELSYKNMSEAYVYPHVQKLQHEVNERAQAAATKDAATRKEKAVALGLAQTELQRHITEEWWSFAEKLIVRYNDGFFNFGESSPQSIDTIGYPAFWLEMVGYDQRSYIPTWFSKNATPPALLPAVEKAILAPQAPGDSSASHYDSVWPSHLNQVLIALVIGGAGGYSLARLSAAKQAGSKNGDAYARMDA